MRLLLPLCLMLVSTTAFARGESWYWGFGLGYASSKYPSSLQSAVDAARAAGASHTPVAVDLGFHWPIGGSTTLGVSINGGSDSYSQFESIAITQTGVFATLFHSFASEPMRGFFLRGDLGLARLSASSSTGISITSDYGFGAVGGGGFMIPVSDETRLVFMATYGYRRVESNDYGLFSLTFGPMF